ncbi:DUF3219 family protein [Oceanobacillus massiliensis]|nr:DUF3219 family protein [Oceanobacillus massiliensis]
MNEKVWINELELDAKNYQEETVSRDGRELLKIVFEFEVTSKDYHDVTVHLYKNDFIVRVPERNLEFSAVIHQYSTSITNLYEAEAVGEFKLELIEK